jgi:hypothetical protein
MVNVNLKESLSKLDEIVDWFNKQTDLDVEVGLEKVREGAALVKACKTRLGEIKNEFEEIQSEVQTDEASTTAPKKASRAKDVVAEEEISPDEIPF